MRPKGFHSKRVRALSSHEHFVKRQYEADATSALEPTFPRNALTHGGSTESRPPPEDSNSAQEHVIRVTPRPIFTRLKGSNDRVAVGVKMFRGVAIRRRVAAAHMSAGQTEPQVDPGRTDFQTFLTAVRAGNDVGIDLIEVRAGFGVHDLYASYVPNSISPPPTNTVCPPTRTCVISFASCVISMWMKLGRPISIPCSLTIEVFGLTGTRPCRTR